MALVKCPECGKEVSDCADACPNCGYGIKKYFTEKRNHEIKLNSVRKPEEPQFNYFQVGIMTLPGFLGFLFNAGIGIVAIILFFIFALYTTNNEYDEAMKKYNLAQNDFERYKREEVRRRETKEAEDAKKIKCPHCNSTNIEKISTVNRATSIAMTGLASGKIGKQYKCKNCKHMW